MNTTQDVDVLLAGAAGFVGSRLWSALAGAGLRVRCVSRDPTRARRRWPEREWVQADLGVRGDAERVLAGCRMAYYLVHSMDRTDGSFREREVEHARTFADAAARAGLARIVYLGGVQPVGEVSEHLASRLAVGETLRNGRVPTLELRAGMIVGFGSTSWLMVRDLAARLPLMVLPRWLHSRSQPIGIDDVIVALLRAREAAIEASTWFDIPGPQAFPGKQVLEATARALELRRPLTIDVPFLSPTLSSHWIRLVTRADWSVARELVLGLRHDLLARDDRYWQLIGHHERVPFELAARRAIAEERTRGRMSRAERVLEASVFALRGRGRAPAGLLPPQAEILVSRHGSRSVQTQEISLGADAAAVLIRPPALRQLVHRYFREVERVSLGLTRVTWNGEAPTLALRWPPLPLVEMGVPSQEADEQHSTIRLPILGGLVAEPAADGATFTFSAIATETGVRLSVELRDYRPRGGRLWIVRWLYRFAQEPLHALVGRRFLRRAVRGQYTTVPVDAH